MVICQRVECIKQNTTGDIQFRPGKQEELASSWHAASDPALVPFAVGMNTIFTLQPLYTALKSPSLIFALQGSETDSLSLEFARSPILLHNPVYNIIQLTQFWIRPQVKGRNERKIKRAKNFPVYSILPLPFIALT